MKTTSCTNCGAVTDTAALTCSKCGVSPAAAKIEHSVTELKQLTQKLRELNAPRHSFNSFNGCGTMLLDYRALPDGTYVATRWVTVLFLPLVPLSAWVIEPTGQEVSYGRETSRFSIIASTPVSPARALRTYLLVAIGLAPVIIGSFNSHALNHVLGGPVAFFAMLATIAWGIYIIFFRLKNDGKAYKATRAPHS